MANANFGAATTMLVARINTVSSVHVYFFYNPAPFLMVRN
jgi:hypothetical protein